MSEARQAERVLFQDEIMSQSNPDDVVVLDETGFNLAMTRGYARSIRGTRAESDRPANKGKNVTLLSAMTTQGALAWSIFDGALTGKIFLTWLDEELVPRLRPGQMVVMDNLSVHKVAGVREKIESAGATLVYLPPYSPELSPIELMWSWVKSWMRRFEVRNRDIIPAVLKKILQIVDPTACENWFRHCGWKKGQVE